MGRSGYADDIDNWALIKWRGQVTSASRGRRGQLFFLELIASLDALPEKKLIAEEIEHEGAVCAIGAVGRRRGIDMTELDPYDREGVAGVFKLPFALACELFWENDECGPRGETPEARWKRIRAWAVANLRDFELRPSDPPAPFAHVTATEGETR
jgi:hypothetical protein